MRPPSENLGRDWSAGALAGGANFFVGYPWDMVKVRLQSKTGVHYSSGWQCFRAILRHEGVTGVFRGMSAPLIGGALETGVNYAVYKSMISRLGHLSESISVPISGATAGVFLSFIISPAELIKCRMQMGAVDTSHAYSGPIDCARQIVRSEGHRGMARGLGATLCREVPGNALFFTVYMNLREVMPGQRSGRASKLTRQHSLIDTTSTIACGAMAGMVLWGTILPIDAAKTRIQTAWPGSSQDVGVARQLQVLYREGGIRRLWAGLSPTLARAAPANAAQWLVWEWTVKAWDKFAGDV